MHGLPDLPAAILLASGFSKRFGEQNKLLFSFRGKPLARYTLELASAMDFSGGIFFVAACDEVAALASDLRNVNVIKNGAPEKGLRESVRLGVEAADTAYAATKDAASVSDTCIESYLFFPCDQPFLDVATVRLIIDERVKTGGMGCIVEPRYKGRPGDPCLFSRDFREELLSLKEGETPRLIKSRHPEALRGVEVLNPLVLEDIDDEESLERLSKLVC